MLSPLHLRTLSVVLRSGSFAAAGRQLGYTGSAVSQQITALEADTRLTLFERSGHAIHPTPAAHLLNERAGESLGALATLDEAVRQMAAGTRGRLALGSFPTASEVLVPPALRRFSHAFPDVDVRFHDGEQDQLVPRLLEGDLDIVLAYHYDLVPRGWAANIERTPLMDEGMLLLIPPSVDSASAPLQLADVADYPWISTLEDSDGTLAVERACAAAGFTPRISFRTNDYDVIASFVQAGLGVAAAPLTALSRLPSPNVANIADLSVQRHIEVLTLKGSQNPAVGSLLSALRTEADHFTSQSQARMSSPHAS